MACLALGYLPVMTTPDPGGTRDTRGLPVTERPIDITDTPDSDWSGPAPTPEHHPDDVSTPRTDVPHHD